METTYEAKGKQVWLEYKTKSSGGCYAIAICYTEEIAKQIAKALTLSIQINN